MSGIISRIVGLGTIGLVGYNAHIRGKIYASKKSTMNERKRIANYYLAKTDSPPTSYIGSRLQSEYIKQRVGTKIFKDADAVKIYFSEGLKYILTAGLIPLALSCLTFSKNKFARFMGLSGIAFCAATYLIAHVLKFGSTSKRSLT